MNKGLDKLFDLPLIGLLLSFLFSEHTHVLLAAIFTLGGLCWLINLLVQFSLLDLIAYYLMIVPVILFGIWIVLVLLFVLIEKRFFHHSGPGRGMNQQAIDQELKKAVKAGRLELSIRFNSSELKFSNSSQVLTLNVTGGQDDPVDEEMATFLSTRTNKKVRVEKGKNRWRRMIYFD